jgi:hypothetical protein
MSVAGSNGGRDPDRLTPGAESAIASNTIFGCGNAMAAELKEIMDAAVSGKETLCLPGRFEALHLSFSSSRRLM